MARTYGTTDGDDLSGPMNRGRPRGWPWGRGRGLAQFLAKDMAPKHVEANEDASIPLQPEGTN